MSMSSWIHKLKDDSAAVKFLAADLYTRWLSEKFPSPGKLGDRELVEAIITKLERMTGHARTLLTELETHHDL